MIPLPHVKMRRAVAWVLVVYSGLGLGLWVVPLFNLLHAESSAVVAGVAFFAAGLSSLVCFRQGASFGTVLMWQVAALLVPWFLLTVTLIWVPNCGYGQGLLFYTLFAPISVALAVALAFAISGAPWRFKKTCFVLIGLAIAVLTTLYDLGLHPQFFVYNHVFGGVLGPIYDEELVIRPGLVVFRGMTLLWAVLGYLMGHRLRAPAASGSRQVGFAAAVLGLGGGYLFAAPLGINTPGWYIQDTLGGVHHTAHFEIYYDPASLNDKEVQLLAADHEFRYDQLADRLEIEVPERIISYLYPDPDVKARLTGARTTNVAPVWLRRPQVHVLLPVYNRVFAHELAHVFSRGFGMPGLRASFSVGLVEGLAVAVEPPDGLPTPHEQVAAATMQRLAFDPAQEPRLSTDLAARLSPLGFWTGRGAVSYTTMGSFVRYLLDAYGPGLFKQVYAWGNFEAVYGKPLGVLAAEWEQVVLGLKAVDRATGDFASARFSIPSLFEKRCPHYVPPYRRAFRRGMRALAAEDTAQALVQFERALQHQSAYEPAQTAWAHLRLAAGAPAEVVARLDTVSAERLTPALALRLGDAQALLGHPEVALAYYEAALKRLPSFAREDIALVVMRKSLANEPQILHILTAGGTPEERARRLAGQTAPPEARVLEAFLWAVDGRFEQAVSRLRTTPVLSEAALSPYQRNVIRWQRLSWLAQWVYGAGEPGTAAVYAQQAAQGLGLLGALNAAAQAQDFEARMAWSQPADYTP